jgi:hypothetical protein
VTDVQKQHKYGCKDFCCKHRGWQYKTSISFQMSQKCINYTVLKKCCDDKNVNFCVCLFHEQGDDKFMKQK